MFLDRLSTPTTQFPHWPISLQITFLATAVLATYYLSRGLRTACRWPALDPILVVVLPLASCRFGVYSFHTISELYRLHAIHLVGFVGNYWHIHPLLLIGVLTLVSYVHSVLATPSISTFAHLRPEN